MAGRHSERLGAATGLTATLVVGAAVLLSELSGSGDGALASTPVWWVAYGLFLAAFSVDADVVPWRPAWATSRRLVGVELVAGSAAWLASPGLSWTAVLLVVTAASAAYTLTPRGAVAVVAVQTFLVALGTALDGQPVAQVVTATAIYGIFQGFAVLVVGSERREAEARAELATAHAQLRAASVLLEASTRTAERLRISRDLHDVMGHQLTALALELEVATHHCDGEAAEHVGKAQAVAKDLLRGVRETVGALRTGVDGLAPTLRALVADVPGLAVDLDVDLAEGTPVDDATALALVRCVQEILTNTLRHAQAERLVVRVAADGDGLHLDARDDGCGADGFRPGNGLDGLRERIEQLGGRVELQTAPGEGFAVRARVPAP